MPAGALERAVELLERLGEDPAERTVAELAGDVGMPTSTAYRLIAELERYGLVQRGAGRTLSLGTRVVALGRSAEENLYERLVAPAVPEMTKLARQVQETVILTAACGLEAISLYVIETEQHPVRLSHATFRRAPMHRGASGKILAAHLEAPERERLLAAAAEPGLRSALDEIRAQGVAVTTNDLDPGASAIAVPILDARGRLVAGLSVAGPTERISAQLDGATAAVRAAAREIEAAL